MKLKTFPKLSCSLLIDDNSINYNVDNILFKKINNKKKEIDSVQYKWDSAKKISNDYEYIYTSSNYTKNISDIIPVSRSFFKLREIIYDFKLLFIDNCSCIAEAPGGFMQSLLLFSKEKQINLDCITGITLVGEDKEIPYWNPNLLSNPKIKISNGIDNTGDLYKLKNVLEFIRVTGKHTCSLVTADGGFDYTKDFEQELSSYKLIFSEIMIAINIQKDGGSFICKFFDLFWYSTLQLIYILYLSYDNISFIKPSTSRQSNSEKYIVCRGFKGYNKTISNLMCSNFGKSCLPIKISNEFLEMMKQYNKIFINNQIMRIDTTLKLITQRRVLDKPSQKQIKLAVEWCKKYEIPINTSCIYLK